MNRAIILYIFLMAMIGSLVVSDTLCAEELSDAVEYGVNRSGDLPGPVEYALNCFAVEQQKKNLILVAKLSDLNECGKIKKLGYFFDLYDTVTMASARALITDLMSKFLTAINGNKKLTPFLFETFTEKNLLVRIRLRNKNCGFIYPKLGNIAYISAMDGEIIYDTVNSYTYDLDTLNTEKYP